jgi:hypothetical protein
MTFIRKDVKFHHDVDNGITICYRIDDARQVIDYAVAYKHPNDNYNHKTARLISQGRLLKGCAYFESIPLSELKEAIGVVNHHNISHYLEFARSTNETMMTASDRKEVQGMIEAGILI